MSRTIAALTVAGLLAGVVAFAAPASAHVTVASTDAKPGGYGVVAVRVPTESDTASTVKVELAMPTATPFAYVGVQHTDGWTDATTTAKLAKPEKNDDGDLITSAVSTVTWTATAGSAIKPGHFQQFFIQVGPFPSNATSVSFSALQYYSDGTKVSWNETQAPGQTQEPDHPAPTLTLTRAATTTTAAPAASASKDDSSDTGPLVLSIVALVVAVGAAGFAVVSRARSRASS